MKTCKYCKPVDDEICDVDFLYHGEIIRKVPKTEKGLHAEISTYLYFDAWNNPPILKANTDLFGVNLYSKDIPIKYCPFCGRKLEEE